MKTDKQTFVFRLEWAQVLKQQPDSIRLAVYDAIIDYVQTGNEPPQDSAVYFAFLFIKNQIDKDAVKYAEVCAKRAAAGKKHKGNQHTNNRNKLEQSEQMEQVYQNGTNGTDSDNEYDNDNVNNNVNNNNPLTPLKGECVKQEKELDFGENEKKEKSCAKKETKHKYGEYQNVKLTDDEVAKLKNKYGDDAEKIINYFDAQIEMKGYKYKSHYLAILDWGAKAFYELKTRHSRESVRTWEQPKQTKLPFAGNGGESLNRNIEGIWK